jgi:hypothetical protein
MHLGRDDGQAMELELQHVALEPQLADGGLDL